MGNYRSRIKMRTREIYCELYISKKWRSRIYPSSKIDKKYGAATVVMAIYENGQADSYERRIEICERSYRILVDKVKFNFCDIIFDPNIFPVATGMEEHRNNAVDF